MRDVPPQNLEAEESVLGAMLLSGRAIEEAAETLDANDFYRESHGTIFQAIVEMHAASQPVDAITVADTLTRIGKLDNIGGSSRIAELAALVPAASNIGHYAGIVANEATRRALIRAGMTIVKTAEDGGDAEELVAQAEQHLSTATTLRSAPNALPLTAELPDFRAELLHAYTTGKQMFGKRTGFSELDGTLLGLWPGQLIVLAARPGQGKSALALNIAENFVDAEMPALIYSLEMSRRELLIRSLARASRIDGKRLMTGTITEDDVPKLRSGLKEVESRAKLFIEDDGGVSMPSLRANAIRLHRTENVQLVVVDYLQLMSGPEEQTNDRVAAITRALKQLARKLDVPILALSQMNRGIESRSDKRPQLSDLRDSGAIEQDADVVLFLHDDAAYDPGKLGDGSVEVIVAKNRKGETGSVKLLFLKRFQTFQTPTLHPTGGTE